MCAREHTHAHARAHAHTHTHSLHGGNVVLNKSVGYLHVSGHLCSAQTTQPLFHLEFSTISPFLFQVETTLQVHPFSWNVYVNVLSVHHTVFLPAWCQVILLISSIMKQFEIMRIIMVTSY